MSYAQHESMSLILWFLCCFLFILLALQLLANHLGVQANCVNTTTSTVKLVSFRQLCPSPPPGSNDTN